MSARIIAKNHMVFNNTVTVLVNGKEKIIRERVIERKPPRAQSDVFDEVVFSAIKQINSFDWADVYNHFDSRNIPINDALERALNRHCI